MSPATFHGVTGGHWQRADRDLRSHSPKKGRGPDHSPVMTSQKSVHGTCYTRQKSVDIWYVLHKAAICQYMVRVTQGRNLWYMLQGRNLSIYGIVHKAEICLYMVRVSVTQGRNLPIYGTCYTRQESAHIWYVTQGRNLPIYGTCYTRQKSAHIWCVTQDRNLLIYGTCYTRQKSAHIWYVTQGRNLPIYGMLHKAEICPYMVCAIIQTTSHGMRGIVWYSTTFNERYFVYKSVNFSNFYYYFLKLLKPPVYQLENFQPKFLSL